MAAPMCCPEAMLALRYLIHPTANYPRCPYCDGTGDVHRISGEWLGSCDCAALSTPTTTEKGEKL